MPNIPKEDPFDDDDPPYEYDMDEPGRLTVELPAGLSDEVLERLHDLLESLTNEILLHYSKPIRRAWHSRWREEEVAYHRQTYVAVQLSFPFMDEDLPLDPHDLIPF
jgi:hypothetical protein